MGVELVLTVVGGIFIYFAILWLALRVKRRREAKKRLEENDHFIEFL